MRRRGWKRKAEKYLEIIGLAKLAQSDSIFMSSLEGIVQTADLLSIQGFEQLSERRFHTF